MSLATTRRQWFVNFRIAPCQVSGQTQNAISIVDDHVLEVIDGRITGLLPTEGLVRPPKIEVIDGAGRLLTPGLIDPHTHLVFGGNRAAEWEARVQGVSYAEIAQRGGGILASVAATRAAGEEPLWQAARGRLRVLMRNGVTTVEIKSGYGLNWETEAKMLRVAQRLAETEGLRVATTLLAAHAIPPEYRGQADAYVDLICRDMIPAAKAAGLCSAVDAFCETIAFDVPQTLRVLAAARDCGLGTKVHAEQLSRTGIAALAAEQGAWSVDHVEYLSDDDCRRLGQTSTVAVLLPGAFYYLRERQAPPVAELRRWGVPLALATDANPGSSPVYSPLVIGNLAANLWGLTPRELMEGMTIQAARALNVHAELGSLEVGKWADLAVWDVDHPAELFYSLGWAPCHATYRAGQLLWSSLKDA